MYHKEGNVHNMTYLFLAFIFIALFFLVLASIVYWSLKNGISPMPTSRKSKKAILAFIPKNFSGKMHELGSGWGSLLIPLGKSFPESTIIGYETSPIPYAISKIWVRFSGLSNIQLKRRDFFEVSLEDSEIVVCYLFPGAMNRLRGKFETELKPGTLVITNTFAIPNWKPLQVANIQDLYNTKVYLYKV